jgi:hypothetical protein
VPRARASAQLKRRTLAARLDALALRHIRELEASACVDPDKLEQALELLKMAKLAARPRRRKRKPGDPDLDVSTLTGERLRPIMQLASADVDLHRAPRAAIDDFLANREPPAVPPPRRRPASPAPRPPHRRLRRRRLPRPSPRQPCRACTWWPPAAPSPTATADG